MRVEIGGKFYKVDTDQISISFTIQEWVWIIQALEEADSDFGSPEWEMDINIIDRIEKRLGIE